MGDLSVKLREGRLRWFGHVWRRDDQYVGKKVWNLRVGTRGRKIKDQMERLRGGRHAGARCSTKGCRGEVEVEKKDSQRQP